MLHACVCFRTLGHHCFYVCVVACYWAVVVVVVVVVVVAVSVYVFFVSVVSVCVSTLCMHREADIPVQEFVRAVWIHTLLYLIVTYCIIVTIYPVVFNCHLLENCHYIPCCI